MFLSIDDARIYTVSFGSPASPAILGIGGWIGSWELWTEPFSILSRHWHTIAYDHRGSGATSAPVESITSEQLVDDVFAVMDAYEIEQCVLAAESVGARTALGSALKHPERICGLVLVDGSYFDATPRSSSAFLAGLRTNYSETLRQFVNACIPESDSDHLKRWGLQILERASPESAIALFLAPEGTDLRKDLSRVTQPTLVIHGQADVIAPLQGARLLASTLPNAKLTIIAGAGHVPTMTRPEQVAAEIMNFFHLPNPDNQNLGREDFRHGNMAFPDINPYK